MRIGPRDDGDAGDGDKIKMICIICKRDRSLPEGSNMLDAGIMDDFSLSKEDEETVLIQFKIRRSIRQVSHIRCYQVGHIGLLGSGNVVSHWVSRKGFLPECYSIGRRSPRKTTSI